MRTALVIALESPNPLLPRSFSFDYGFPRTALLIASCIQEWGAKVRLSPRVLNADAAIRKRCEACNTNKDVNTIYENILVEAIHKHDPELICVVAPYTNVANWAIRAATICRKTKPEALIITGGPHASFVARSLVEGSGKIFDAVLLGPGESKIKHLLENFDKPTQRFIHPGISTPNNSIEFSVLAQRNNVPIPPIDYSLINPEDVGHGGAVIMASRGCPNACQFCLESFYWRQAKVTFHASRVRKELIELSQLGVPVFGCGDSLIDMRLKYSLRFESFCQEAFSGLDLHEHFFILTRLHMLDRAGCHAFRQAGGRAVWVGLETASTELLASMGKGEMSYIVKERLATAKIQGLRIGAFFMFGYPGETKETAEMTLRLMEDLFTEELLDYVDPSIFVPYPGLPMYDSPQDYRIEPHEPEWSDWDHWGRYNDLPVYDLVSLTRNEIFKYWKEAMDIKRRYDIREKNRVEGGRT